MSDNKQKKGQPDRSRISLSEDYEKQYWREKFGVSGQALAAAVRKVGNDPKDVGKYLDNRK